MISLKHPQKGRGKGGGGNEERMTGLRWGPPQLLQASSGTERHAKRNAHGANPKAEIGNERGTSKGKVIKVGGTLGELAASDPGGTQHHHLITAGVNLKWWG